MQSKIPWDQVTLPTLTALCRELGYDTLDAKKEDLITYLHDVNINGIKPPKPEPNPILKIIMQQYEEQTRAFKEKREREYREFEQKTADFWNGNIPVDPALERFDAPGSLNIIVKCDVRGDGGDEDAWLKVFRAVIKAQDGQELGKFCFRVVNLPFLRQELGYYDMYNLFHLSERGGSELEGLGCSLFTEQGRPNPEFYSGGSGAFGPEIALASFALLCGDEQGEEKVDYFCINSEFRHRGVGTQALKQLFQHESLQNVKTLFVWPSVNDFPLSLKNTPVEEKAFTGIVKFFTGVGFRHVGSGPIMAYVLHDNQHPSRLLAAANDAPLTYKPMPQMPDFFGSIRND